MEIFEIYENVKSTPKSNEIVEKIIKSYDKSLNKVKSYNEELYNDLKCDIYVEIYGCHFNEWLLKCATENMQNEDGTAGAHWTLEQTNAVARDSDIKFINFNQYDWNYVMNMIYSDYYGVISNDISAYVKMAKRFIMDKDSPKGKAYHYYMAMKKNY